MAENESGLRLTTPNRRSHSLRNSIFEGNLRVTEPFDARKPVASINAAAADVTRQVAESMPVDFAKGDEQAKKRWQEQVRQRVQAALQARVLAMLNPAQEAALEKAAADQIAAQKAGKGKPKRAGKPRSQDRPKGVDETKGSK